MRWLKSLLEKNGKDAPGRQRGQVLIFVTIGLLAFLALTALATDSGKVWVAREQVRAATDAATLAGAGALINNGTPVANPPAAVAAVQNIGPQNQAMATPIQIAAADIQTGEWNPTTRTFTALPGSTDKERVRAVQALGRKDSTLNAPVTTVFGQAVGVDSVDVSTLAVAWRDYAATFPPGSVELPIVIDCCKVSNSSCDMHSCDYIDQNGIPNPQPLQGAAVGGDPEFTGTIVTYLEFFQTPDQNACWSVFDGDSPSVNTPDLQDIVQNGNGETIGGDETYYMDNGTKTPIIREIHDKFYGEGGYERHGDDTNNNGIADSWPVVIPIVQCQDGIHCATGTPQKIVGAACFDIREVRWDSSPKYIAGDFLCATDSKCNFGGLGPGGGIPGTLLAEPVLVR